MMDGFEERQAIIGGAHAKVKHDSAARHVTGKAIFIDDIVAPPVRWRPYLSPALTLTRKLIQLTNPRR